MQETCGAGRRIPIAGKGADRARPVGSADPQPRSGDRRAPNGQMLGPVLAPAAQRTRTVEAAHGPPGSIRHARRGRRGCPNGLAQIAVPGVGVAEDPSPWREISAAIQAPLAPGYPRVSQASHPLKNRTLMSRERSATYSGRCPATHDFADVEHGFEPGDVPREPPLVTGGGKPPPGLRPGDHCSDRVLGPAPAAEPGSPQGCVNVPAASGELLPADIPGDSLRDDAADPILITLIPASPFRPLGVSIPGGSDPNTQPVDALLDMRRDAKRPPGSAAYLSKDPRGRNRRVRAPRLTHGSSKDANSMQKLQGHNLVAPTTQAPPSRRRLTSSTWSGHPLPIHTMLTVTRLLPSPPAPAPLCRVASSRRSRIPLRMASPTHWATRPPAGTSKPTDRVQPVGHCPSPPAL